MERFVEYYNGVRLHSAIGYIAPLDFMDGKATQDLVGARPQTRAGSEAAA